MQFFCSNQIVDKNDLPRLVILTGLNGSGKTRGLKAMQANDPDGTQYIDYRGFAARWNMPTYTSSNDRDESILRQNLVDWKFPIAYGFLGAVLQVKSIADISESDQFKWIEENRSTSNFARLAWQFFEIFPEARGTSFSSHPSLLSKNSDKTDSYWRQFGDDPILAAYKDACKRSGLPAHMVTDQAVIDSLDRLQRLKHPLQIDISSLVTQYVEHRNGLIYECWLKGTDFSSPKDLYETPVPNPLEHINTILAELADEETGVFMFTVASNVTALPATYAELKQPLAIDIKLRDNKTGALRDLAELSSGEQTLLALATLIYTHKHLQPLRALYLDAVDASLHPSMIKSMLHVFREQSGDTRIFLATHSPSTVALAPEGSLFFVEDGKAKKIGQTEALEGLTQGFITTEGISSVFRSIRGIDKKIIVISEGNNYEYLGPMFGAIGIADQCHIHAYRKARSGSKGATEFKVLHQLFCDLVDTLPNGVKIVFLMDCDQCAEIAKWGDKNNPQIKVIALKQIKANPLERGIENVVPRELLLELENKLAEECGGSIYKDPGNKSRGLDRKDLVCQKFTDELKSSNSRIDIQTLRYTLSDLIAFCNPQ